MNTMDAQLFVGSAWPKQSATLDGKFLQPVCLLLLMLHEHREVSMQTQRNVIHQLADIVRVVHLDHHRDILHITNRREAL